jgi:hypothetical protein
MNDLSNKLEDEIVEKLNELMNINNTNITIIIENILNKIPKNESNKSYYIIYQAILRDNQPELKFTDEFKTFMEEEYPDIELKTDYDSILDRINYAKYIYEYGKKLIFEKYTNINDPEFIKEIKKIQTNILQKIFSEVNYYTGTDQFEEKEEEPLYLYNKEYEQILRYNELRQPNFRWTEYEQILSYGLSKSNNNRLLFMKIPSNIMIRICKNYSFEGESYDKASMIEKVLIV